VQTCDIKIFHSFHGNDSRAAIIEAFKQGGFAVKPQDITLLEGKRPQEATAALYPRASDLTAMATVR
jgi:hypothetical protein